MAGVDYFFKLGDIKGESTDKVHKDAIEIMSWSFGATQSGSTPAQRLDGAGKVNVQDITFTKKLDKASANRS